MDNRSIFPTANQAPKMARFVGISTTRFQKVFSYTLGAKTDRAELAKVIGRLEPDDVLVVTRLDRLARSTRDLLNVIDAVSPAVSPLGRLVRGSAAAAGSRRDASGRGQDLQRRSNDNRPLSMIAISAGSGFPRTRVATLMN